MFSFEVSEMLFKRGVVLDELVVEYFTTIHNYPDES